MPDTIYFTKNGTKLEKKNNSIFAIAENQKQYFPIEQVKKIVVFGAIHITQPLFNELAFRNIPIIYYTYGGKYKGMFMPPEKNEGKVRMYQYQTYFDEERRLELAKQIIACASKNKITILKRYYNKYQKQEIQENIGRIEVLIKQLKNCDNIPKLRGYEGIITKHYYSCFQFIFKKYSFEGRNRQPPQDEINCLLSFANCCLYNEVVKMIHEVGLDFYLGFVHEQDDSKPALALDVAEIFRQPICDSLVFEMINNNMFDDKHFNRKEDMCLLNNFGKDLFLRKYEFKMEKTFLERKSESYVSYRNSIRNELYKLIKYFFKEMDKFEGFRIY